MDDNCDGGVDEGLTAVRYADQDNDGYGNPEGAAEACLDDTDFVDNAGDCNDADFDVNPAAEESCNERDDNCDGAVDEGLIAVYYADADADGYGDPATATETCDPADGWTQTGGDCDDADAVVSPGATEECNDLDDDCDGEIDEGLVLTSYPDADGDGYGDDDLAVSDCEVAPGYTATGGDCDDSDPGVNPAATDIPYDGIDQDCSGADSADVDGDGYDAEASGGDDCDDTDANVNPGVAEVLGNGIDDNCNGETDEISAGCADSAFSTVQDAVDAAASGDTITLCGSFTEDIEINGKDLTLDGDPSATITAASDTPVSIYDADVALSNLTLEGSVGSDSSAGVYVYGLTSSSGGSFTLSVDNCTIRDNEGFGIAVDSDSTDYYLSLEVTDSTIDSNGNTGVSTTNAEEVVIENSTITNNARGVWLLGFNGSGSAEITDTVIEDNGIPAVYAISADGVDLDISGGSISDNSYAHDDGSSDYLAGSALTLDGISGSVSGATDISDNAASAYGAICLYNGDSNGDTDLVLTSAIISGNTSASGDAIVYLNALESGDTLSSSAGVTWSGNSPNEISVDGDLYTISDLGTSFSCDVGGCN